MASGKGGSGLAANSEHGKRWMLLRGFFKRRAARVVGVVVLGAVVVVVLFMLLNLYVAPTTPSGRKDLVLALAQILGGMALLSGLYFTWRTLQINREGQITERFTRAIDQLGKTDDEGNKMFEIRIGGIYALARIARESEEDHWPIMEVLTAYVRQHAPWQPEEGPQGGEDATIQKPEENSGRSREESEPTEVPASTPDIQAIMTVIRRRTRYYGHGEPEPLDLHQTNLTGATLTEEANLRGAILTEANLRGADLSGADLWAAFLTGADLSGAFLRRANLQWVHLREANLRGANLFGADLRRATLTEAIFTGADLRGADLREADLSGADLTQDQLEQANGDENTRLPSGLKPPVHWGMKSDEQAKGE